MSVKFIRNKSEDSLVWYACYGSNMDANRLACYIQGGTPLGGARNYRGCDDKSMPTAETSMELPYPLYFAGESKVWTGGVALIDSTISQQGTKGKAYLITSSQFEQVAAQESGRDYATPVDIALLRHQGQLTIGDGSRSYDKVLYCGEYKQYPVLTLTSPFPKQPYTKPSHAYIRVIVSGLQSTYKLTSNEIFEYLYLQPGISGKYTEEELSSVIARSLTGSLRWPDGLD